MTVRLLLVEDDRDLREFIQEGLAREGFTLTVSPHGKDALEKAREQEFDAILMDVMMPHLDGLSLLKTLRSEGCTSAILLVTCKGQERDKLAGLNSGADDYIVKPFLMSELIARVRAVLRRTAGEREHAARGSVLQTGPLELDLLKRKVRKNGREISLTKKEFDLLECFMRRAGQVLSQTTLSQHISNSDIDSHTNVIEVHIKNLRAKLDSKGGPSLIRTVRGCGYALDA